MAFAKETLGLASVVLAFAFAASPCFGHQSDANCEQAARSAELRNNLPSGLLGAIGKVESGGWGWSVNGNDGSAGRRFATAEAAISYTDELLGSGLTTIDVGCFQVDLRYHPDAFRRWQDGFDGDTNANAAASILGRLHAQTGDWSRAVALYHSADPTRGRVYLQAVMSAWGDSQMSMPAMPAATPYDIELQPVVIPVAVWIPGGSMVAPNTSRDRRRGLPRVITP